MNFDPRLQQHIDAHPFPLLFATISGAHKLFQKENPPRIKPLLYVYRVLLTGIYLMKTGVVEANLVRLNEQAKLDFIPELIERKRESSEKERLTELHWDSSPSLMPPTSSLKPADRWSVSHGSTTVCRSRERGLAAKRSLALREFALGIEALERFVTREPLRRVHECVFGVLALESEPVDPRL